MVDSQGGTGSASSGEHLESVDEHNHFHETDVKCLHNNITQAWHDQWSDEFFSRSLAGEFADEIPRTLGELTHLEVARIRDFFHNKFGLPRLSYSVKNLDYLIVYVDFDGSTDFHLFC